MSEMLISFTEDKSRNRLLSSFFLSCIILWSDVRHNKMTNQISYPYPKFLLSETPLFPLMRDYEKMTFAIFPCLIQRQKILG